jgi:hypothetical protein
MSEVVTGVFLAAILAVLGYGGRRLIESLEKIIEHLAILNHRTEKLEARMSSQEDK